MIKKYLSKLLSLSLIIGLSIGFSFMKNNVVQAKDIKINRISGQDRFDTCVKVSQYGWSESYYAVLCNSDMYADAVVSSPLAYKFEAPILLVNKDSIPDNIVSELQRLKIKKVFIVGGTGVISKSVENQLSNLGIEIEERIAGQDRFETALKVKHHLISADSKNIYVVDSEDWQSALETSPIACATQCPIIYGDKNGVSNEVKQNVNSEFHNFQVIGENSNKDYVNNTKSWLSNGLQIFTLGQNKTDTNLQIYETFKDKFKLNKIFLVSNSSFADGLCISNIAGAYDSPILFVNNDNIEYIKNFIYQHRSEIDEVDVIGGEGLIPQSWLDSIQQDIQNYSTSSLINQNDRNKPLIVNGDIRTQAEKDKADRMFKYWQYLQKNGLTMEQALNKVIEKTGNKDLEVFYETTGDKFKLDTGKDISERRFYRIYNHNNQQQDYIIDEEDGTIYKKLETEKNIYTLLQ